MVLLHPCVRLVLCGCCELASGAGHHQHAARHGALCFGRVKDWVNAASTADETFRPESFVASSVPRNDTTGAFVAAQWLKKHVPRPSEEAFAASQGAPWAGYQDLYDARAFLWHGFLIARPLGRDFVRDVPGFGAAWVHAVKEQPGFTP